MKRSFMIAAAAALVFVAWSSSATADPKAAFEGAARLFRLDRVTVVYPSAAAKSRETNRLCAVRAAAFLQQVHGVETRVVADSRVDDELLRGDLLLLGWDNRLLGTREAPRPFRKDGDARRFLGTARVRNDEDLLFAHPSPYNPERHLIFWSRLDPELDRFWGLPFQGSDWAIYRDYLALQQGMFESGQVWPPARNTYAEKSHRHEMTPLVAHERSARYTLRYAPNQLDEAQAREILAAREKALDRAIDVLGDPGPKFRIDLYLYPDTELKDLQSGVSDPAHNIARRRELHMTERVARSSNPHEDSHVLARALLGPCYLTALYEGLALTVEKPDIAELAVYAAMLVEQDRLPAIDEILDEERQRALSKTGIGFPAAALLVHWLRSTSDADGFRAAYNLLQAGEVELARLRGQPPGRVDREFAGWVERQAAEARDELAFRRARIDARLLLEQDDLEGGLAALRRAVEIRPAHAEALYELAVAQIRAGEYQAGGGTLTRLLELPLGQDDLRFTIFAEYQYGRALALQGRRDEAMQRFRRVLELPDRHDAHRRAREAMVEFGGS